MARVLVIDDDRDICEMLSSMVERMGHDAEWSVTAALRSKGISQSASGTPAASGGCKRRNRK